MVFHRFPPETGMNMCNNWITAGPMVTNSRLGITNKTRGMIIFTVVLAACSSAR
jgi:hypothetical protein